MDITIRHILDLPVFKKAVLLTGDSGLDNVIRDISVLESPITDHSEDVVFSAHEFYLTGLFAYAERQALLETLFDQLISEKCCGVCVFDTYFKTLPEAIVKKCQKNNLTLMMMSDKMMYSSVLKSVFQEIIRVKDEAYIESTIEAILSAESDPTEVRRKAVLLNKDFNESHMCVFINAFQENPRNVLQLIKRQDWFGKGTFASTFRDGVVVIESFMDLATENHKTFRSELVHFVKESLKSYNVGISSQNKRLSRMNISLSEAVVACSACSNIMKQVVLYENLGVYKLLYRMRSDVRLSRFRDDVLNPIREYEAEHQVPLMETAVQFVEYDGDIKATAKALFLHENTVRYRIEKIKKILNLEDTRFKYYEELSLAIKADKILKRLP